MKVEFFKIDEEELKNNCYIIKLGSNDRPASQEDMDKFNMALDGLFSSMKLDFTPAILITHHAVSFESISKEQTRQLVDSFLK